MIVNLAPVIQVTMIKVMGYTWIFCSSVKGLGVGGGGYKFFPFRVDSFSEGSQNDF